MPEHISQLLMFRKSLMDLPKVDLPEGYSMRCFQEGDEAAWDRIITDSFGGPHSFAEMMLPDASFKPERVILICKGNEPVATASAWVKKEWPNNMGYVHMVGALTGHLGKRLGFHVSLGALRQMKREGRTQAVLHTDDFRIPAIKTYLKLGFLPVIMDSSHQERWNRLSQSLLISPQRYLEPKDIGQ